MQTVAVKHMRTLQLDRYRQWLETDGALVVNATESYGEESKEKSHKRKHGNPLLLIKNRA